MAEDDFQPKLGRIRSTPGRKNERYLRRVIRDMSRATHSRSRAGRSLFSGSRSGRGYSAALARGGMGFAVGRRRVVIKARFTRFKSGDVGAACAHLKYIQRDGVTREGERGTLYGPDADEADGKALIERSQGDRHQFRFIVALEDGAAMEDLKPFVRDLMRQAENDLGTKLDWVAVDHFNTGHPHTHIVVRGKDDLGKDLVIARDYLSHGLRDRARDLVTLELGPETKHELDQKIEREVQAERLTRLDRSLLRDTDLGILAISSSSKLNPQWRSHRMGRLRKLESMGLAEELKPGVWKLADRTETVLRQLGERGDIMKTMQRVLKEAGIDRGASDFAVFDAENLASKVTGKVVAMGLSNELQDHHYMVVDGTDGKLHYAEVGRLSKYDPPARDMVVTLRGRDQGQGGHTRQHVPARVFIESHVAFRELATTDGATWLDRKILAKDQQPYRDKGFGAEVNRALRARQQWLMKEGLITEKGGRLIAQANLLRTLRAREVRRVASKLSKELGLTCQPSATGERLEGKAMKSITLASGRFIVVQRGGEFSLVPWREAVKLNKSQRISLGS
ncbi:MAG: DUF3363 domain-containing protein [Hyphomicrobiaceae bacterium]|nr:DUF3363 domain-containing protein [Hyphomicrobiaceae bacterium]